MSSCSTNAPRWCDRRTAAVQHGSAVVVAAATTASATSATVLPDVPPARTDEVPFSPRILDVLAACLARCGIAEVVVEGVPVIGDLRATSASGDATEEVCPHGGVRCCRAGGSDEQRWPDRRAHLVARGLSRAVLFEEIERPAAGIGQEDAELGGAADAHAD